MNHHKFDRNFLEYRENFRMYYNQHLRRDYQELEPHRKKYLCIFYCMILFFTFIYCMLFCVSINIWNTDNKDIQESIANIFGIYTAFVIYICSYPFSKYKSDTKRLVMNKILSFFGTFQYGESQAISSSTIKTSGLFGNFNNQTIDDNFNGTYKDTRITVSEQKLANITGSGKNRRKVTLFKGVLILLDMQKKSATKTTIKEKAFKPFCLLQNWSMCLIILTYTFVSVCLIQSYRPQPDTPWYTQWEFNITLAVITIMGASLFFSNKKTKAKKMQQVTLEDVVFDKHWKVQSTDQIEARYILTPALMERMLEIKRLFHGKAIEFSFWNNKCLIAVHTTKDMFETTSLFTPALSYHKVQEVISQFYSIFSTVDLLNGKNK